MNEPIAIKMSNLVVVTNIPCVEPVTKDGLGCGGLVLEIPRHELKYQTLEKYISWSWSLTFGPEKQSSPSSPAARGSPVSRLTTFILNTRNQDYFRFPDL